MIQRNHFKPQLVLIMTGSGKSEFIITYILSMALNYSPYEVSFVLIDYKGGGLAGVFENKENNVKLPHIAGTITNLDTIEMNRSLASIQSELRKRQRAFNEARDKLDESTIDIYKYQKLYRKGLVSKPISHLFIISDEFAELKDQQPEFMDQLISTARIGRSLGVHLILATQKPAGVVNDQIWSNSKFRVCLKVQDKSDSMDMIKCPDAAALKEVGRFYLQVGYNELFAMGQAAWAGAQYYPAEKRKKKVDQSIEFVDNTGNSIKSIDTKQNEVQVASKGEEITNIIKYIVDEAKKEDISIEQLWLDRIPNFIYVEDLKEKYHQIVEPNIINPIIGEYDDPDNQRQGALTLPLSSGNVIIFGSAGSGKELMLSTIIYSIITTHDSKEVNFYILDFGAETLTMFKNAPHVGEVLLSTEEEKINNLFKMVKQIMEERKKEFVDYNGSYDFYISHGGKQIPQIVVIINNIEGFFDTYPDYDEAISQITRECLKYGIIFILSTNGPNTIRYKLRQNFAQNLALQFNDPSDYSSVIPGARRKEPSKSVGRGLIGLDNIYEFQTAYAFKEEKLADYIRVVCNKLNIICSYKAKKVPILPDIVTQEDVINSFRGMLSIPVGISKETLDVETISLRKNIYVITGDDISSSNQFIIGLSKMLLKIPNNKCLILDGLSSLENVPKGIKYGSDKCVKELKEINTFVTENEGKVDNKTEPETTLLCIIIGLGNIMDKMDSKEKKVLTTIIEKATKSGLVKFIIIERIDSIKNINYEQWFRSQVDLSEGIWIGNGISNQFTLKINTSSRILRQELAPGFGYVINKGKAVVIKLLSDE